MAPNSTKPGVNLVKWWPSPLTIDSSVPEEIAKHLRNFDSVTRQVLNGLNDHDQAITTLATKGTTSTTIVRTVSTGGSSGTVIIPGNTPAILHQWIDAYDASTGMFHQSQPDYSDLTGTPTLPVTKTAVTGEYLTAYDSTTGAFSQSTPAGISVTVTTAALTLGGTQGSMTYVGGLLTAQTPAT